SGAPEAPVVYAAYPGENVTLSGGQRLTHRWRPYRDGILQCHLPEFQGKQRVFTQLFVDGKRQIRARYPNYDVQNPLVSGKGYLDVGRETESWPPSEFHYNPETFTRKRWSRPEEAVVFMFPQDYWGNLQWQVREVDWNQHAVKLGWGGFQINAMEFGRAATGIGRSKLYSEGFGSRFFIENVFEELDAPGEWYLDAERGILYCMPPQDVDLSSARVDIPILDRVIEFHGSQRNPVQHITFSGFRFAHTASTFLNPYEAPSRGDWTLYRGGAVFMEGAEDCAIEKCFFDAVGGNAVFVNNYNRRIRIYGNKFTDAGDSAVCLVGSEGLIQGSQRPLPMENTISNNLIHDCGIFGKQVAGVFVSISEKDTISHNVIYNMPRAGICINDGWGGGHLVEFNEIHDTVRETTDHGPFNSWGRGRYWCFQQSHAHAPHGVSHGAGFKDGDPDYVFFYPEEDGSVTTIRNNYFHEKPERDKLGIDLDDGSSHYHIYNNLCVGMSVKFREGDYRTVENNIFINPSNPPGIHQGCEYNHDRFLRNVVVTSSKLHGWGNTQGDSYQVLSPPLHGPIVQELDYNLFFSDTGQFSALVKTRQGETTRYTLGQWQALGYDRHSLYADPLFTDPATGDYRVEASSPALKLGFKTFDLNGVGLLPDFPAQWREP
ncbi:MAG TPA: right-handed parallel beta-helix repeat-containing protein, partial [Terriglobia bacterium]|nr:right-handed parallel beta-helix repeat-containing protein [Terriglobia bacterium]